jgi:23S rRNA pseudouridine1911/1915/1917 synthase
MEIDHQGTADPLRLEVNAEESGLRLDGFLALRLGGISRMRIARVISAGACTVNSTIKEAGTRVFGGDLVEVRDLDAGPSGMTAEHIPLEMIYEDDHLIVLAKPTGMLVHPTLGVKRGTLSNALAFHLNRSFYLDPNNQPDPDTKVTAMPGLTRPGIVHRLDRATSGLLAVAKTQHALTVLTKHFRRGLVKKRYLAIVHGGFAEAEGSISAPIGRDGERRPHWWVMEAGKPAETKWRVLGEAQDLTLVELEPVTGRTNQLRIHMAYTGRPIVGDPIYGLAESSRANPELAEARSSPPEAETESVPGRLLLHAWRLAFHHPETGDWHQFTSAPPPEMAEYLRTLGIPEPEPSPLPM